MSLKLGTCSRYYKLTRKSMRPWSGSKVGHTVTAKRQGEPIGLKRLEARPIAALSLEAQEWHEQKSGAGI